MGVVLVCVLGVAVSASVFGVAGLELVDPPVESDWASAPAVLVLAVLESEPVCALAGKASIPTRKATNTGLKKCLGEAGTHIS